MNYKCRCGKLSTDKPNDARNGFLTRQPDKEDYLLGEIDDDLLAWECPACGRISTLEDGNVKVFREESPDPPMPARPPANALKAIETVRGLRSWSAVEMYAAIREACADPAPPAEPPRARPGAPPVQGS